MKYYPLFFLLVLVNCSHTAAHQEQAEAATTVVQKDTLPLPAGVDINYVLGKFNPAEREDFSLIETKYADRAGLYMRTDAYEKFKAMHTAAQAAGIRLVIRSAARNFDYQKGIWERKWRERTQLQDHKERALNILEYSSMPGSSRHHWGTDIDLNNFNNSWFETGEGLKLYEWMQANAATYGFCQPYSPKGEKRPDGYNEEKWHWSYLPVAQPLTELARRELRDSMIQGFAGSKTATEIGVVQKYVLGINSVCTETH